MHQRSLWAKCSITSRINKFARFFLTFSIIFLTLSFLHTNANANECDDFADLVLGTEELNAPSESNALKFERRTLFDFLSNDPGKNLFVQHPANIMNTNAVVWALVMHYGIQQIAHPLSPTGKIDYYNLFSGGPAELRGKRVFENWDALQAIVENMRQNAQRTPGEGAASSAVVFLEGPAGTGKSMIAGLIQDSLAYATTNIEPFYRYYNIWGNLDAIPTLRGIVPTDGHGEFGCPMHDSPFTILPESMQDAVLQLVEPTVIKLTNGIPPRPKRHACSQCNHIKDEILRHHIKVELDGRLPTVKEELDILSKHISFGRVVLGNQNANTVLEAQPPNNENWGHILGTENAPVFVTRGASHPFAYFF